MGIEKYGEIAVGQPRTLVVGPYRKPCGGEILQAMHPRGIVSSDGAAGASRTAHLRRGPERQAGVRRRRPANGGWWKFDARRRCGDSVGAPKRRRGRGEAS